MITADLLASALLRTLPDYAVIAIMLLTAALLFRKAHNVHLARLEHKTHDSPWVWGICGSVLLLFTLIKSLNMLAVVGTYLRELSRAAGTYEGRSPVQRLDIGLIGLFLCMVIAAIFSRPDLARRHWFLILCVGVLGAWGMARFVSLHAVDALVAELPWLRTGVEIALTSLILIYTLLAARKLGEKRVPSRRVKPRDPAPL